MVLRARSYHLFIYYNANFYCLLILYGKDNAKVIPIAYQSNKLTMYIPPVQFCVSLGCWFCRHWLTSQYCSSAPLLRLTVLNVRYSSIVNLSTNQSLGNEKNTKRILKRFLQKAKSLISIYFTN